MRTFRIEKPDSTIAGAITHKIDNLTKPQGSLGRLEELALQIGLIQQTLSPQLKHPHNIVFAADHGIVAEGISLFPAEVTPQMVLNFIRGGAGINFLARQHNIEMKVVDAGVNYDFEPGSGVIDLKIRKGTSNYLNQAAMSHQEFELCIERGAAIVEDCFQKGCNIISFGEMGIGNTSSSSMWMHRLTGIPLVNCVGAGAGFDNEGIRKKYEVLKKANDNYAGDGSWIDVLSYFGGFEMVMAVGAMLRAAELKMIVLVDGFIMSNCFLAAAKLHPEIVEYAIFGHLGDESGHKLVISHLNARPLLNFSFRLGEGTGALCAYPLIESSVRMINEMSSFEEASVSKAME